ncbi:hypothetical protein AMTRI_Chr04g253350 [Amborella trichopoda]
MVCKLSPFSLLLLLLAYRLSFLKFRGIRKGDSESLLSLSFEAFDYYIFRLLLYAYDVKIDRDIRSLSRVW